MDRVSVVLVRSSGQLSSIFKRIVRMRLDVEDCQREEVQVSISLEVTECAVLVR